MTLLHLRHHEAASEAAFGEAAFPAVPDAGAATITGYLTRSTFEGTHSAGQMEYTDVHRAETVATEVVTDFAAAGTPAEEDWMGAWRAKSFQAKSICTSIWRGFVGVEGEGVDEVDADVEAKTVEKKPRS
ncbi:hypothetical protein C8R44DRAFT_845838 [Mycena epipterygia]|nr:hypothetical protein C8R44DRAFT_845838 [Mycena epipterygia]